MVLTRSDEGSPCSLLGMAMHSDGNGGKHLNGPFMGGVSAVEEGLDIFFCVP